MRDLVARVIQDLNELIVALDRRVPRVDSPSEREIARDAKVLRDRALQHIKDLEE